MFRHVLRLVLLLGEFSQVTPPGMDSVTWRGELKYLADRLTASCREVDPTSTEYMLSHAADQDIVVREPPAGAAAAALATTPTPAGAIAPAIDTSAPTVEEIAIETSITDDFGAGIVDSE